MPFAPHEIENKKFVVALRGYATNEVDAFLRAVAADYKSLLDGAQTPFAFSELENVMRAALDQADAIKRHAEAEAEEIRRVAEEDALVVRRTVRDELAKLHAARVDLNDRLHEIERRTAELRRVEWRLERQRFSGELEEAILAATA